MVHASSLGKRFGCDANPADAVRRLGTLEVRAYHQWIGRLRQVVQRCDFPQRS